MPRKEIEKLAAFVKTKKKLIILLHNNPDPDCIGSALAIKAIVKALSKSKVTMVYGGIIGRAENLEMIRALKVKLVHIDDIDLKRHQNIIMVDTQPMIGNNSLPKGILPKIVIDHHPLKRISQKAECHDVRVDYGSTSAIILEYLTELEIKISSKLATALYYGIQTDTDDIGRDRTKMDNAAMTYLYPLISPMILSRITHPRIPMDYFIHFFEAMNNACLFNDVVVSDLKDKCTPEMIGEMSDFFMRLKGIRWVICLGTHGNKLFFSIRTTSRNLRAGKIAVKISRNIGQAGGHHKSAGGYIKIKDKSIEEIEAIKENVQNKFLKAIKRTAFKCKKMIQEEEVIMKKYECIICGYIYDPESGDPSQNVTAGTAFENLPDDWCCPECGATKEEFEAVD